MKSYIMLLLSIAMLLATVSSKKFIPKENINFIEKTNRLKEQPKFDGFYIVQEIQQKHNYHQGILKYNGKSDFYMEENNPIIKDLNFQITFNTDNELTYQIYPSNEKYFSMPREHPFPHEKHNSKILPKNPQYTLELPKTGQPMSIKIKNVQGGIVYNSNNQEFIFTKFYVQFGTQVINENIWGWGERRGIWQYKSGQYTIWNYDNGINISDGKPGQQTYGLHPMWLQRQKQDEKNSYHIVYLRTTYGLQMDYQKNENLVIKMSKGPVELKFFVYDTPQQNIQAYLKYINGWQLHPFWSMGFHICRWGLKNSTQWEGIWQSANENKISFDTMWSDIDYLLDYEDFTISDDYDRNTMKKVTDLQTQNGVRWVPIIDAGVKYSGDSGEKGEKLGLFIMSSVTKKPLIGCVWPGPAHFVDFNHKQSGNFWVQGLKNITEVYDGPQPSGIWLDMNDPSSFTKNDLGEVLTPQGCGNSEINIDVYEEEVNILDNLINKAKSLLFNNKNKTKNILKKQQNWGYPWSPMGDLSLSYKTLSTTATHVKGSQGRYMKTDYDITEYEMHNLYAFFEGIDTNTYLKQQGFSLPFIITRSSAAGGGAYVQHWTGDNYASWDQLETSLGDIFNFQLFGIPVTGADVCGFGGTPTPELCARWYQLGSWYPFFRSHNAINSPDQYPWSFPQNPYVLESSRKAINYRYSLLKWYYSIFVRSQPYGTVFKPLFFDFPDDEMAVQEAHQALIGEEIMITPVLKPAEKGNDFTQIKIYFPGKISQAWFDIETGKQYYGQKIYDLKVPINGIVPAFQKAGTIVAFQPQYQNQKNIIRTRQMDNQFQLQIALNGNYQAQGSLIYLEDYDEKDIKQYCVGDKNCLINIRASLRTSHRSYELRLYLDYPKQLDQVQIQYTIVKDIRVYVEAESKVLVFKKVNKKFSRNYHEAIITQSM